MFSKMISNKIVKEALEQSESAINSDDSYDQEGNPFDDISESEVSHATNANNSNLNE